MQGVVMTKAILWEPGYAQRLRLKTNEYGPALMSLFIANFTEQMHMLSGPMFLWQVTV